MTAPERTPVMAANPKYTLADWKRLIFLSVL
jgi:hypothetical protein